MQKPTLKGQRLAALFVLGCLLFNYPLLSLLDSRDFIWGIPALYAYLFVAWALFIAVAARITEKTK
jgi:predicted permease